MDFAVELFARRACKPPRLSRTRRARRAAAGGRVD